MLIVLLFTVLSTALYYLTARAKVTEFLWSRYPHWLEYWLLCAACSGFWYGLGLGIAFGYGEIGPAQGVWGLDPQVWYTPLVAGLTTMVTTPILAYYMVSSWTALLETSAEVTFFDDDDGDAVPKPREYANTIPLRPPTEPPEDAA